MDSASKHRKMATERLYYGDAFLREFDATVITCEPAGDRWQLRLDRTAFYPTSGGQPFDSGKLNDVAVVDVSDEHGDEIVHVVERQITSPEVHGIIDWPRRFDHMQQHTAQHMLSAAFIELFGFQTISFHLGRDISTIDLATASVVPRHLEEAERRVNAIIFEDREITVRYGTAEQLAEEGIRKKVDREGTLRVIDIEGFDRQPCGGTHLSRTGQAGMLLLRKCERQKQNWRVEFVAGFRALGVARNDLALLRSAAEEIGCGMAELPQMIAKMQGERRANQRDVKKITESLAELEAARLLARSTENSTDGSFKIVNAIFDDAEQSYLAMLAAKLTANPSVRAVLAGRGAKAIVLAQSAGLDGDMGALLRELLAKFGGKGGGSKTFAQGSVADASAIDEIVSEVSVRLLS